MSEGNLLIPETTRNGQNDRLEAYPTDRTLRDALADISLQASAKLNRLEAEVQELPPELLQLLTPVFSRFQGHLHRSQSGDHQIDPFLKIGQRKAVRDNFIHRQQTLFDHPDSYWITSRAQMGAMNVQFL